MSSYASICYIYFLTIFLNVPIEELKFFIISFEGYHRLTEHGRYLPCSYDCALLLNYFICSLLAHTGRKAVALSSKVRALKTCALFVKVSKPSVNSDSELSVIFAGLKRQPPHFSCLLGLSI